MKYGYCSFIQDTVYKGIHFKAGETQLGGQVVVELDDNRKLWQYGFGIDFDDGTVWRSDAYIVDNSVSETWLGQGGAAVCWNIDTKGEEWRWLEGFLDVFPPKATPSATVGMFAVNRDLLLPEDECRGSLDSLSWMEFYVCEDVGGRRRFRSCVSVEEADVLVEAGAEVLCFIGQKDDFSVPDYAAVGDAYSGMETFGRIFIEEDEFVEIVPWVCATEHGSPTPFEELKDVLYEGLDVHDYEYRNEWDTMLASETVDLLGYDGIVAVELENIPEEAKEDFASDLAEVLLFDRGE